MAKKRKRRKKNRWKRFAKSIKRMIKAPLVWGGIIVIACTTIFFGYKLGHRFFHKKPQRTTIIAKDYNGIDISRYQTHIDWQTVAANKKIQFVYIKATEGASHTDSYYNRHFRNAKSVAIKVGSYHFFSSRSTPEKQFANFKKHVRKSEQDLIPMVDVEERLNARTPRATLQKNLQRFMDLVKEEYGVYPLLYSQYTFYKQKLSPEFDRYYIFMARYSNNPPVLDYGGKVNIWQFTEHGRLKGVRGSVDLDRFCQGTSIEDIEL